MIIYTYKNTSNRISYHLDENTTIGPGETKTSTVKLISPQLQVIKTEEINDNVSVNAGALAAIQATCQSTTLSNTLSTALLTTLAFNKGAVFTLEDTGKIRVKEDGLAIVICNVTMNNMPSMSGEAHSICRTTIKRHRSNKDTIIADTRNFIKYYSNTGAQTTACLTQLQANDVIFVQLSCNHERTATASLSLITL